MADAAFAWNGIAVSADEGTEDRWVWRRIDGKC